MLCILSLSILGVSICGSPQEMGEPLSRSAVRTLVVESKILAKNPLKDPSSRKVAVFLPAGYSAEKSIPVVYFLPGFGGGSQDFLNIPAYWLKFVDLVAQSVEPIAFVVIDGKNRFGCSQYIDSSASGNYAQYICKEVIPQVEKTFHVGGSPNKRVMSGHSSGGFGALRLGMSYSSMLGHIVALSPDSDFELSHKGFTTSEEVKKMSLSVVQSLMAPVLAPVTSALSDNQYAIALCADYAGDSKGGFHWLYDEKGNYLDSTWQMWLHNDPLYIVTHSSHPFSKRQTIYCEGPKQDDFQANVGARKIYEALAKMKYNTTFYEPPGHHGDHLQERILHGIGWSFGKAVPDIQ